MARAGTSAGSAGRTESSNLAPAMNTTPVHTTASNIPELPG